MPDSSNVQREVEAETRRLFPAAVRRVTVRLESSELENLDRLITAGVASSRAEALRWALGRLPEAGLQLATVSRGQDDLGHQVGAQAELLRDLFRPPSLLVVEQREFLL